METGILATFSCPSCGNTIKSRQVLIQSQGKYKFNGPDGCACGRRAHFDLKTFEPMGILIHSTDSEAVAVPKEIVKPVREYVIKKMEDRQNENQ